MTKEERAEMSRQNGARSNGPKTEAGKSKSRLNSLKTGEHATVLAHYVPTHPACLCNEDRDQYRLLVDDFIAIYKPVNPEAMAILRDIATARWQIDRLQHHITIVWNKAIIDAGQRPNALLPELHEMYVMGLAVTEMLAGNNILAKLNREITRLQRSIGQLEKRLIFVNEKFPLPAPIPEDTENEEVTPETAPETGEIEPPIIITEDAPEVIAAYRRDFPGRPIVILPAEKAEKNDYNYDDMPVAPRKAA